MQKLYKKKFEGIFTALITPFNKDNIDYDAFTKFVEWQIKEKIDGLVICGTTGEGHSLSEKEYLNLISLTIKINQSRAPIIVGVPSNSTRKIISLINKVKSEDKEDNKSNDIAAFLVTAPYYIRPTQEGIFEHFKAICETVDFPIIVYNVPHRCNIEIDNETMIRIMGLKGIIGIKDATNDLEKPLIYRMHNKEIALLSGNDTTYLNFKQNGGDGCISVVSNIIPGFYKKLHNAINTDINKACHMNEIIFPLSKAIFCESNPIPIKYAVSLVKKYILPEIRLPLTLATDNTKQIIQKHLRAFNENIANL